MDAFLPYHHLKSIPPRPPAWRRDKQVEVDNVTIGGAWIQVKIKVVGVTAAAPAGDVGIVAAGIKKEADVRVAGADGGSYSGCGAGPRVVEGDVQLDALPIAVLEPVRADAGMAAQPPALPGRSVPGPGRHVRNLPYAGYQRLL